MGKKTNDNIVVKEVNSRSIPILTRILLFSKAAGRCHLCNELVINDAITGEDVVWAEMAHIYAFGKKGPRANEFITDKNNVSNLFLGCPGCHTKADKGQLLKYYTVEYLQQQKKEHEDRIRELTKYTTKHKTKILKMVANIAGETVTLTKQEMIQALMTSNLIPCDHNPDSIDFTAVPGLDNKTYWNSKKQEIDQFLEKFESDLKRERNEHISIFALGPIPLLVYLGSKLNNKIKTKFFQRHRDAEEAWKWKKVKGKSKYALSLLKKGTDNGKVALLLSLSGPVDRSLLPKSVSDNYSIYELRLVSAKPNYNFLEAEDDLFRFQSEYTSTISEMKTLHPGLKSISLFPAIPAPIAIVCGRALNKNSDPKLKVYNTYNRSTFKYSLTIN